MEQVGVFDLAFWNSFYGISEHLLFFFSLLFFCIPWPIHHGRATNHDKLVVSPRGRNCNDIVSLAILADVTPCPFPDSFFNADVCCEVGENL